VPSAREQIADEADAFDAEVLSKAPKFRAHLEELGVLCSPDLILEMLASWRRGRQKPS
jgi:hypothetical protein